MILSVSRRTDIPAFFSEWFMKRMEQGEVMVRNPLNQGISRISLNPQTLDCICFWTKNPEKMIARLPELKVPYYFQFTLNGYGRDMEMNLPDKNKMIEVFKRLHDEGNGFVIWRYDPIIFTPTYHPAWHLQTFAGMASELKGYTDRVVISFCDYYGHVSKNMVDEPYYPVSSEQKKHFCGELAKIAKSNGMEIFTCAEALELADVGIQHGKCIDPEYIEKVIGCPLTAKKDATQRKACGCVESLDIGKYDTCCHGCKYCYATNNQSAVRENLKRYRVDSPILCDTIQPDDKITERAVKSLKAEVIEEVEQLALF